MNEPVTTPAGWTPREYVLHQTFCPIDDIVQYMADYLGKVGATELCAISFGRKVMLQTLTLVVHADTEYGRRLEQDLSERIKRLREENDHPLWTTLNNDNLAEVLSKVAGAKAYEGNTTPPFLKRLMEGFKDPAWHMVAPYQPIGGAAVNAILIQRGGHSSRSGTQFCEKILACLNGTANASVYRDHDVTSEVDKTLSAISMSPESHQFEELFRPLLSLARTVTRSEGAALYFTNHAKTIHSGSRDRMQRGPVLEIAVADSEPTVSLRHDLLTGGNESEACLTYRSFVRERPLLLPVSNTWDGVDLRPTWLLRSPGMRVHELAMPVPGPAGGALHYQGALTITRPDSASSTGFGQYDLALLRNVGLRIALLRSAMLVNEAARLLSKGAPSFALTEPSDSYDQQVETRDPGASRPVTVPSEIPADVASALPKVRSVLRLAARITESDRCSFRLLMLGEGKKLYPELELVRVTAWPERVMHDSHAVLPLREQSSNAWVAGHGIELRIDDSIDTDKLPPGVEPAADPHRPARSELCIPVIVDQRLVGTFNLESRYANAFVRQVDVARAAAAQISILIAGERRRDIVNILSIGTDVKAATHELVSVLDVLQRLSEPTSHRATGADQEVVNKRLDDRQRAGSEIADVTQSVDNILMNLQPETRSSMLGGRTIADIVIDAADTAKTPLKTCKVPRIGPWPLVCDRRLYLAFFELFRNVAWHGPLNESGIPSVYGHPQILGGRKFIGLEIQHALRPDRDAPNVATLYRRPIEKEDRLHFGAFLAGAAVRSIGGDILARVVAADHPRGAPNRQLSTIVYVPEPNQTYEVQP